MEPMIKDPYFERRYTWYHFTYLMLLIYANIKMEGDIIALYYQLRAMGVHTHVLSLCTFINHSFSYFYESR